MHHVMPLQGLRSGETAHIVDVVGLPDQVQRIKEMGLRSGVQVEMVRAGAPCILRLAGHKLCFRANDSLNVLVRPAVPA